MDKYNRVAAVFCLCLLTGWLAYLQMDFSSIDALITKLSLVVGWYMGLKEFGKAYGLPRQTAADNKQDIAA